MSSDVFFLHNNTARAMMESMNATAGNGSDSKDEHAELKKSLKIMSCTIYSLVFVLGVLGNGVVIWVTGFKMKKTVHIVWYLNLAVADFLFTAFLPLTIIETALDNHWPFGVFMCKMNFIFLSLNMYASVYILMVISVDRCASVVWPFWARTHRTVKKASRVSLGVWVLALALSSPNFFFRDTREKGEDIKCLPTFALNDTNNTLWKFRLTVMVSTEFVMAFVVPFTIIVSCYSVMFYRLKRTLSQASLSRRWFKIMATVITGFFLCWAPFHIIEQIVLWLKFIVAENSEFTEYVIIIGVPIARCLAFLNSCLNPLLYVYMGKDFKDEIHKLPLLKWLENTFTDELPQNNTSTKPAITSEESTLFCLV